MKKIKYSLLVLIVLTSLSVSVCSDKEEDTANATTNQEIVKIEETEETEETEKIEITEKTSEEALKEETSEEDLNANDKYFGVIDSELYINDYYGFNMSLPDTWTAYSTEELLLYGGYESDVNLDEEDGFYFFDFTAGDGINEVMGMVNRLDPDLYSSPEEYVDFNHSIFASDETMASEVYSQTINGVEYYGFHLVASEVDEDNMIIKMLVTEMNGDLIEFSAIYLESNEEIINQIFNSIKL